MKTCRILVLNYNGISLLEKFLPSVIEAAAESRYDCKVTVLDNASQDGSASYVRERFPGVDVYEAAENKVLCSYNQALLDCAEDIAILLNNDIQPEKGFVDPLIEPFLKESDVFFTATHGDCPTACWRWGILSAELDDQGYTDRIKKPGVSFSAGIAAFDRDKFNLLGGYDELYLPGRYEDVDLCFRGWKKGWRGIYVPASRKYHVGGASFEKAFTPKETQAMVFRNGILFMIKNITNFFFMARFVIGTLVKVLASIILFRWQFVFGFWGALRRFPQALEARKKAKLHFQISDREVLNLVNGVGKPKK